MAKRVGKPSGNDYLDEWASLGAIIIDIDAETLAKENETIEALTQMT